VWGIYYISTSIASFRTAYAGSTFELDNALVEMPARLLLIALISLISHRHIFSLVALTGCKRQQQL
jgi:hypothetical protein